MVLGAKKRVMVHTQPQAGSQTFEGIMLRKRPEIVLELVDIHVEEGKKVQVKGRVSIPREHVAFWQVLS